jgi:hypothetical protein
MAELADSRAELNKQKTRRESTAYIGNIVCTYYTIYSINEGYVG